jgi:hypothetical protein
VHKVQGKQSRPFSVLLCPRLVEIPRQFRVQQLQELDRKRPGVVVHLMVALGSVIAPSTPDMERIQMVHIGLNPGQGIRRAIASQTEIGKHAEPQPALHPH